jgi:hypothetical protein
MTGCIFGDGYAELQSNALVYVQATEAGGIHPALVEAMGRGACIVAKTCLSIARRSSAGCAADRSRR